MVPRPLADLGHGETYAKLIAERAGPPREEVGGSSAARAARLNQDPRHAPWREGQSA